MCVRGCASLLDLTPLVPSHVPVANDALIASGQSLLDQIKTDLNLTQGEVTMFIPDMPNVPPQDVPVIIAQAEQAQQSTASNERKMGVCKPIDNSPGVAPHGGNVIVPTARAGIYSRLYEHQKIDGPATVTVLRNPKHGVLRLETEADRGTLFSRSAGPLNPADAAYVYLPDQGYLGNDSATFLVDIGGKTVKVVYYFKVVDHSVGNDGDMEICKTGPYWKISSTLELPGSGLVK